MRTKGITKYMASCRLRINPAPVVSRTFWIVMFLIWLDLTLTISGVKGGMGSELNPLYRWFTEQGVIEMFVGAAIYTTAVIAWFTWSPDWIRALTAGFLTSIHVFGALSWGVDWVPQLNFLVGPWFQLIGAALLGASVTVLTLLDVQSCPPFGRGGKTYI